jgi:hypothetical protein
MIRLILTAALIGGLLQHVFGQGLRPRKRALTRARTRKPARRQARRAAA